MVNADITGRKSDVIYLKDKLTGDRLGRTHTIRTTQLFSCKREKPQRGFKMSMTPKVIN